MSDNNLLALFIVVMVSPFLFVTMCTEEKMDPVSCYNRCMSGAGTNEQVCKELAEKCVAK